MSDWMRDAQRRIEERKRQQETEAARKRELAKQAELQQKIRVEAIYQELERIMNRLGVRYKLDQLARRFFREGHETEKFKDEFLVTICEEL